MQYHVYKMCLPFMIKYTWKIIFLKLSIFKIYAWVV